LSDYRPAQECKTKAVQNRSSKKSHKNDSGLQRFELRRKVDKAWTNNTGKRGAEET